MIEEDASKNSDSPLLRTVESAARVLQISRTTLYMALQTGRIKAVKLGRSTRIHRDEIERIAREGLA